MSFRFFSRNMRKIWAFSHLTILTKLLIVLKPDFVLLHSSSNFAARIQSLERKANKYRKFSQSRPFEESERTHPGNRSRRSSVSTDNGEDDVLSRLSDNIDRLGYVLNGLIFQSNTESFETTVIPTKRSRSEGIIMNTEEQTKRTKLVATSMFSVLSAHVL